MSHRQVWVTSDHHFGHERMLEFLRADGVTRVRPEFSSVAEMNEAMVDLWNQTVRPQDKVYHLGDVSLFKRALLEFVPRLNGSKTLILGNHDILDAKLYLGLFKNLRASRVFGGGIIMTHVPVHPSSLGNRFILNVHGHLHDRVLSDGSYMNVCVEQTGYRPQPFEEIEKVAAWIQQSREGAA